MDPLDEFEFRPLSDGLGFHKKNEVKTEVKKQLADDSVLRRPQVPKSPRRESDIRMPRFQRPDLDFDETPKTPNTEPSKPKPEKNKRLFDQVTEEQKQRVIPQPDLMESLAQMPGTKVNWTPAATSFSSTMLDTIFVLAIHLLFTIALIKVTEADIVAILFSSPLDIMPKLAMGLLFVCLFANYLLVCRTFFGSSLGEYAFDVQLGRPEDLKRALYPIKVVWRTALIVLTGIVTLPLLSLITGRDIAGSLSGVRLFRRTYSVDL